MALKGRIPEEEFMKVIQVGGRRFVYDANNNIIEEYVVWNGRNFAKRTYTYDANGNLTNLSEWEAI